MANLSGDGFLKILKLFMHEDAVRIYAKKEKRYRHGVYFAISE